MCHCCSTDIPLRLISVDTLPCETEHHLILTKVSAKININTENSLNVCPLTACFVTTATKLAIN